MGGSWKDWGSKRSPNRVQQATETRLGPRFRGPDVASWPHPIGWFSWFGDSPVSSSGFLVSAPGFDETIFYCWLQPFDFEGFFSTDFQPL